MKKRSYRVMPYTKMIVSKSSITYYEMGVYGHFLSPLQPREAPRSQNLDFVAQERNTYWRVRLNEIHNILRDGNLIFNGF